MVSMLNKLIDHFYSPKFYSGPSPNNNDDRVYKQVDKFSYHIFRQMIDIGRSFIQDHIYSPTVPFVKVSLCLKQLINLNTFIIFGMMIGTGPNVYSGPSPPVMVSYRLWSSS